jgi:predicted DNA-binding protein
LLITQGLDEFEEAYLAAAALKRVRAGRAKVETAEQVRGELGPDD